MTLSSLIVEAAIDRPEFVIEGSLLALFQHARFTYALCFVETKGLNDWM
jgi:hypothetical protein